jgi:hypothetical protein
MQINKLQSQLSMLESIVNHYQQNNIARQEIPDMTENQIKNSEITALKHEMAELNSKYETAIMRLKNLVDEATKRSSQMEGMVAGLRKEIAVLQVEQMNLIDAVERKRQRSKQYYEIAMMQLEEIACFKSRYAPRVILD